MEVLVSVNVRSSIHIASIACDTGCEASYASTASPAFGLQQQAVPEFFCSHHAICLKYSYRH